MRYLTLLSVPSLLTWSENISAQAAQDSATTRTPSSLCFHARPKPACSGFFVTNFGAYAVVAGAEISGTHLREVADWGVMANVGPRDAIGGSVFASLDRLGFALGPSVRYRRWLSSSASLDFVVGTSVVASTEDLQRGSVFGLIRFSPNPWFAIAARPELVRRTVFDCGPITCTSGVQSRGRISLGVELSGVPGIALTGVGGIFGLLVAWAAAIDD